MAQLLAQTFVGAGIDVFLKLPAEQRKVVREVILTFAKAYGG